MLKNKLEALLFSSGRKMEVEELSKLTRVKPEEVVIALNELKLELAEKESSTMLTDEGSFWKLTVKEDYLPLVRKIVTETELSKTIMETLAVIAFKYPIKQSDLIKIRTNKAYDHLSQLEEMGYISRQKHGRTNLIKLTPKFFEYFDLAEEQLKEKFKDFGSIATAIENKEKEIEQIREEQRQKAQEEREQQEKVEQGINVDEGTGIETYGDNKPHTEVEEEKLGQLEVVDEPSEEELEAERERLEEMREEKPKEEIEESSEESNDASNEQESEGISLSQDEEKVVDQKVENIVNPQPEEEPEEPAKQSQEKEEKDLVEASLDEEAEEKK